MMLIYVAMAMGALVNAVPTARREERRWWTTTPPPAPSTKNLDGKMFTLSRDSGGISFFPPNYYPGSSTPLYPTRPYPTRTYPTRAYTTRPYTTTTRPYTTRPYTTTTRPYTTRPYTTTTAPYRTTTYTWTTASPTRGVSVCLRYLTDFEESSQISVFKLSSSRIPLVLKVSSTGSFILTWWNTGKYFRPIIGLWKNIDDDVWKDVCLTLDLVKNVAQVFTRSGVSIRKKVSVPYAWSYEPVIDVSGFDGQVTDVQVWDYPLSYREAQSYMMIPGLSRGSVITWSHVSYAPRGDVLLEDVYERQAAELIGKRRRKGPRRKEKTSEGRNRL